MHTSSEESSASVGLRELAEWCLSHLDTLSDGYLEQLRSIEGYAMLGIAEEDFQQTTHDALELIVRKAAGMRLSARLQTTSESIGRRRASQGVPLELLLQAVRMVFRFLWTTLQNQANAAQREALDQSAVQLWEAIEFHTVRVHAGYLNEVARMRHDREAEIAVMLSEFLDRDSPHPSVMMQVGRTLGLAVDSPFLVMAAPMTAITEIRRRILKSGGRAQVHPRADSAIILVPNRQTHQLLPSWTEGLQIAVAPPVGGLAEIPRAWRIARDLLVTSRTLSDQPLTLAEGWPALMSAAQPDLASFIWADTLEGLYDQPLASRTEIIRTVEAYMRSGSLAGTADALFCHRNTVLKRLGRFKELTGLDPATPWDAATIRIAMAVAPVGASRGED